MAACPPARPACLTPGPPRARPCCFKLRGLWGLALSRPELPPHTDTRGSAGAQQARQEVGRKALPPPGPQPQSCLCPRVWHPCLRVWHPCPRVWHPRAPSLLLFSTRPALGPAPILLLRAHGGSCVQALVGASPRPLVGREGGSMGGGALVRRVGTWGLSELPSHLVSPSPLLPPPTPPC